jgi:hypothetical protein
MVSEHLIYRRSVANRGPRLRSVDPPACTLFEVQTGNGEQLVDPEANKARSLSQVAAYERRGMAKRVTETWLVRMVNIVILLLIEVLVCVVRIPLNAQ